MAGDVLPLRSLAIADAAAESSAPEGPRLARAAAAEPTALTLPTGGSDAIGVMRDGEQVEAVEPAASSDPSAVLSGIEAIARSASSMRIIAVLGVVAMLWWAQVVLIPVVLSILISYALEPVVARLETCHVRRSIAVPLVMLVLLGTMAFGIYALRGQAFAFVGRIPSITHTVSQGIRDASRGQPGTIARVQAAARELEAAASAAQKTPGTTGVTAVRVEEPTFKWSDWLWSGSRSFGEFVVQMFAVLCLSYYLLAAGDLYKRKLVRMVPTMSDKKVTVQILAEIDRQIERFLLARAAISLVVGVVVWVVFGMMGMESAAVWGVLSAVLISIPFAGPTVMVVIAGLAGFVQFGSLAMAGAFAGICVVIGALEGNVLTPWLMSRVGEMNAVAVFVSLLFWGWIWGLWGLLLAVPITAAMKAVCERVPDLSPMAELLKE